MKVLSSANESTFNGHRKYLRCPSQVLSFFRHSFLRFVDTVHYLKITISFYNSAMLPFS
mgnify:CR=1 FL=1